MSSSQRQLTSKYLDVLENGEISTMVCFKKVILPPLPPSVKPLQVAPTSEGLPGAPSPSPPSQAHRYSHADSSTHSRLLWFLSTIQSHSESSHSCIWMCSIRWYCTWGTTRPAPTWVQLARITHAVNRYLPLPDQAGGRVAQERDDRHTSAQEAQSQVKEREDERNTSNSALGRGRAGDSAAERDELPARTLRP